MKTKGWTYYFLLVLLLALAGFGCATTSTESENLSSRPWNSPRGWEFGMPGMTPQYGR